MLRSHFGFGLSSLCGYSYILTFYSHRRYKTAAFAEELLHVLHTLHLHSWSNSDITPQALKIQKVSGSLTNAVFFVSCPSVPFVPTLLLRIYGPSSGCLISRPRELHILHALSSRYHIGPRVYGTFENGRVEEYFESTTLTANDLRDPEISSWIGARMAELHQVDIATVELQTPPASPTFDERSDVSWPIAVTKNVKSWLAAAQEVLLLPAVSHEIRSAMALDQFKVEWDQYICWLGKTQRGHNASAIVFAHNDTQYGNLLRLGALKEGHAEHRQIIVVDFEYASTNPAAFDIANHFHEWTADYHSDVPHILHPDRYPTLDQRNNFYRSYLIHQQEFDVSSTAVAPSPEFLEAEMDKLESQVQAWSPSSHAMWALWGIVQAREALEGKDSEPEFDYVAYAQCRMESFRRELNILLA
ncbi:kinase-like protein [Cytidiella melzeri]|nr:kinase-like protein [Cytidiella melzeri]